MPNRQRHLAMYRSEAFFAYKNMLGVIVQPEFTFVCAEVLRTLPHRDFLSGAA
ncbi:MAG: hypothetical protein IK089_05855, partial [Oxalobacter sp.]|nr:hypothetical protein [Oxalobacter sp.]